MTFLFASAVIFAVLLEKFADTFFMFSVSR